MEGIARIGRYTICLLYTSFSQFFPGGRAELQLVEEPLEEGVEDNGAREPGVEIVAQPPGKRLKSITMLSGGEKTLTAMALLIASFLIRPTPFCICLLYTSRCV